jgi:DNA-directed RNA polymerase specialized sigma subunit
MAKNYFNEEKAQDLIKRFQDSLIIDAEGKIIKKDTEVEAILMKEIEHVIKAIINVYRYYIFEDYDDLVQHALENCYKGIRKYTPSKGTCFNYFSIISKLCLLNYTDRKKKHRNHFDITEQIGIEGKSETQWQIFFDDLEIQLNITIDENFIGNKREKYKRISFLLVRYLKQTIKFTGKSDMHAFLRSYGIKNTEVKAFINEINDKTDIIREVLSNG